MTCKELVLDLLADYLDQTLAEADAAEVARHLERCPGCRAYLNTYDRTRRLAREAQSVAMPEETKARLRSFLLEQLSKGSG